LKLVVAIKAGCGGSEEFYEAVVLPWCLQYKENTREYVRKTWESIEDAGLGADHVYRVAREYDPSFEDDSLEVFEGRSRMLLTRVLHSTLPNQTHGRFLPLYLPRRPAPRR
jgi:hypothetical protein